MTTNFDVRHTFSAPPERVAAGMTDADFVSSLELPDVEFDGVVDRTEDGDGVVLRVRYRFVGHLDPIARRVLSGNRISWVQAVHVDASMRAGTLTVTSDVQPDRLQCSGSYRLEAAGTGTARSLQGALSVKVPLISGRAERAIVPGLLRRIDIEAAALDKWIT